MRPRVKIRLGDLLVQQGIISEEQLIKALAAQKESGRKLGVMLTELGHVTENQLLSFLSQHLKVPLVDIGKHNVSLAAVNMLPEVHARRHRALVLEDKGGRLLVAMSDPADLAALDVLSGLLHLYDFSEVARSVSSIIIAGVCLTPNFFCIIFFTYFLP